MKSRVEVKLIRYDDSNKNIEALKGQWGQLGEQKAVFTVIKNLLFINLMSGANYVDVKLPEVYDGFVQMSDGSQTMIKNSTLNCTVPDSVTGFGILVLKKWN